MNGRSSSSTKNEDTPCKQSPRPEILQVPHLNAYAKDSNARVPNIRIDGQKYANILGTEDVVLANIVCGPLGNSDARVPTAYLRAGPRATNYFNAKHTRAAIVTCGGLCPGLNDVIYHLFNTLKDIYGLEDVYGVRGGWTGLVKMRMESLKHDDVQGIQHRGGTFLGTSRGGFDAAKIVEALKAKGISILFVVGGDGTHRGAFKISEMLKEKKMAISVVGIPKTIDNDIGLIDRSFGFSTAVDEAVRAIVSARTEAASNVPNGVGVVKVMGRHAGFIAAHSSMASGSVDLCLIPELPLDVKACLEHVANVIRRKGCAVIVIAEGAGADVLLKDASSRAKQTDASGADTLPPIGPWFVEKLKTFLAKTFEEGASIKYIDPSYIVRSVPANASDSLYCMMLAQNAVHAAMAGFTGCSVGLCNNRVVLLPIEALVKASPRTVNPRGRTIERLICITRQPRPTVVERGAPPCLSMGLSRDL